MMQAPLDQSCSNCVYCVQQDMSYLLGGTAYLQKALITCRVEAPQLLQQASGLGFGSVGWPVTDPTWWCSHWSDTLPPTWLPVSRGTQATVAGTVSAVDVAMGLGLVAGFSITPIRTGRVVVMIAGTCSNTTANAGVNVTGRYGSGPAPANGSTSNVGQVFGSPLHYAQKTAAQPSGFTLLGFRPTLALNTQFWFDASIAAVGGGTASIADVTCVLFEL